MADELKGRRVAMVATDGFEESELVEPRRVLEQAGATVDVIAPEAGSIQGMRHWEKGEQVAVDRILDEAKADDYDALVLPGGVANPDALRTDTTAVSFIRQFFLSGRPVAAICHGPWTLVEANVLRGRTLTSWPSLKTDIRNAGGTWVDREVVVDQNLVTSRRPEDLPSFCANMIAVFQQARAA